MISGELLRFRGNGRCIPKRFGKLVITDSPNSLVADHNTRRAGRPQRTTARMPVGESRSLQASRMTLYIVKCLCYTRS